MSSEPQVSFFVVVVQAQAQAQAQAHADQLNICLSF